jgi:hypothetical protein
MNRFKLKTSKGGKLRVSSEPESERHCELLRPVRDRSGRSHFNEAVTLLREMHNLDRTMYLVRFEDGSTTFLFPYEIAIDS